MKRLHTLATILALTAAISGCVKKQPAATTAPPPSSAFPGSVTTPRSTPAPTRTEVPPAPPVIPMDQPVTASGDPFEAASLEKINQDSPLKPVFFAYDSDALDDLARATMNANAAVLRKYVTWVVTVEGHCDERGTAEYNLSLGDRRALAVKNYMVSLGIAADRVKTVSYGSEFPIVAGHDEDAWKQNRRAHFMLTAKQ
jgi:peptidoglycan-associated lipoprotein